MEQVINLKEKFSGITDYWNPRIAGELNGQHIKLARVRGEFIWHSHAEEDELFYVVSGKLVIELRDGSITLGPGDMTIIPRGVEHRPVAQPEAEIMMFEPASTVNTGEQRTDRTRLDLDSI